MNVSKTNSIAKLSLAAAFVFSTACGNGAKNNEPAGDQHVSTGQSATPISSSQDVATGRDRPSVTTVDTQSTNGGSPSKSNTAQSAPSGVPDKPKDEITSGKQPAATSETAPPVVGGPLVKKAIDKHRSGNIDLSPIIFRWLTTELWFQEYIDHS